MRQLVVNLLRYGRTLVLCHMTALLFVAAFSSAGCSDRSTKEQAPLPPQQNLATAEPASPTKPAEAIVDVPFDFRVERLDAGFRPHNISRVLTAAQTQQPRPRDEFETSQQYDQRVANPTGFELYDSLHSDSVLAFSVQPESIEYSADRHAFTIVLPTSRIFNDATGLYPFVPLQVEQKETAHYVAANAFGVAKNVSVFEVMQRGLGVKGVELIPDNRTRYSRVLPMPIEEARTAKPNIRFLLIGSILAPFASSDEFTESPTLDHPREVRHRFEAVLFKPKELWIYNAVTREIYSRGLPPAE